MYRKLVVFFRPFNDALTVLMAKAAKARIDRNQQLQLLYNEGGGEGFERRPFLEYSLNVSHWNYKKPPARLPKYTVGTNEPRRKLWFEE
jgi:hypothetical protein